MKYSDSDSDLSDVESSVSSNSDNECFTDSNSNGRAVKLISFERSRDFDETLHLRLDENVLNSVLESCKGKPICVVAAVGHPRTGKSFILNYIKEKLQALEEDEEGDEWITKCKNLQGFQWRHGYKPTTQGIYVWSKAFIVNNGDGKDVAVLLMDTQGINEETPQDERSAILGISILLSSITIFNVVSDIPEEIFNWLSTFVKFGNSCVASGIQDPFQKLAFIVRDWTRLSEHSFGVESGGKFLSKLLASQKKFAKQINECWEELECTLLPNIGSKALLNNFTGQSAQLNGEFQRRLKTFINDLTTDENILEKRIFENRLSSMEYKEYLREYLALFNNKAEMELGLKPEGIWSATMNAANTIKLDRAAAAYHYVFKQQKDASFGQYLKDATIDGVNVHAISKAKDAFRSFKIPKEEEAEAEKKLEQLLKKETEKLKEQNEGQRRTQVSEGVCQTTDKLRDILAREFPFETSQTFYDEIYLAELVTSSAKIVKDLFLEQFETEDEDGMESLNDLADSVLEPIQNEYIDKNKQIKTRIDTLARSTLQQLLDEYIEKMNALLAKLPTMDSVTLNVFHERECSDVMKKFSSIKLGHLEYQRKWEEKLQEEIEEQKERFELGLESTMAAVIEMVKKEVFAYKESLLVNADEMDEDDLKDWHDQEAQRISRKVQQTIPFLPESSKGELVLRKVRGDLESTYREVVEEGVMVRRKQQEELDNAKNKCLNDFKRATEQLLKDRDFLESSDLATFLGREKGQVYESFQRLADTISPDIGMVQNAREVLVNQVDRLDQEYQRRNDERRDLMNSTAESEKKKLVQSYNLNLTAAVAQLKTNEELVDEHKKQLDTVLESFQNNVVSSNKNFVDRYKADLVSEVEQSFSHLQEYFDTVKNTERVTLMTAMLAVQSEYNDNMNNHFSNQCKEGALSKEKLYKLHEDAVKVAEKKFPIDLKLSKDQKRLVYDKLEEIFKKYKERNELVFHSFTDGEPAIGIDLGTTYCCVAIYVNGKVQVILNSGTGDKTTPSYVRIKEDDAMEYGFLAKDEAHRHDPERTIFDAKRLIGRRFDDPTVQSDMKYWPFNVVDFDGGPKILVNKKYYYPEEISSYLLKHLKEEAEKFASKEIKKAVITVPAYFTDGQRQATVRAGQLAGLEVLGILNEPSAAAVAFKMDNVYDDKKRNVLVYDLGGGTFDVAVLEMDKANINVLAVEGDSHLGGEDFDKNLMKYCADEFKVASGIDIFLNKDSPEKILRDDSRRYMRRLQTCCEKAKMALSTAPAYMLSIDSFAEQKDLLVKIERTKFEELNHSLFVKTMNVVDKALKSAKLANHEIDEILLVGGSTRIPKIKTMLKDHFKGKALSYKVDADQAVAQGAAIQAAMKCAKPDEKLFDFTMIREVTPMSLGIEMATKAFDTIIPKGSKIPVTEKQVYETHRDNQETASVRIFQGENPVAARNKLLGDFTLEGIPRGRAGTERVEVTMHIDNNGILNVEAVCVSNRGTKKKMTVCEERGIMSEEVKKRIIAENKGSERRG